MDNHMMLQMMQSFMPPESRGTINAFREVLEIQQLILHHAAQGGQLEMLHAIRPKLPEHNRHMIDVLIKCMELGILLEKGKESESGKESEKGKL